MWWEHRNDPNMFVLFFDDLKEDHTRTVHRLAKFMDVDCDENAIVRVVHTTSHSEMLRHASKFDAIHKAASQKIGKEPDPDGQLVGRVRKSGGKSGEGMEQLRADIPY